MKSMVTEYNHRGAERTEDERTEYYDYPGDNFLGVFKLLLRR
jgi:hypothetical protein